MTTRILGIDPGSVRTGVGIIDVEADGRTRHVHHAPIALTKADSFAGRLKLLLAELSALLDAYSPQEVAIEQVFVGKGAIADRDFARHALADAGYVSPTFPVTKQHLREQLLGEPFVEYFSTNWPALVTG